MNRVILKSRISNRIFLGHPWIYNNEVDRYEGELKGGDIADVFSAEKKVICRGYINRKYQIVVRLLTRDSNEIINDDFFYRRILSSWQYRSQLGYTENCRLVFGEADQLPQLIIDKFNDYFVVQTL